MGLVHYALFRLLNVVFVTRSYHQEIKVYVKWSFPITVNGEEE